jgi:5-formyltetrahydrofolate cyclo-ligase
MEKYEIRKSMMKVRDRLSLSVRRALSRKIKENLYALSEFDSASSILLYASFRSEVDTLSIIEENIGKRKIYLPKVCGKELRIFQIEKMEDLSPGYCGILEPISEIEGNLKDMEITVAPGVAFSKYGARIGYGGGFYDRLLARVCGLKVGLSFSCQIVDTIPTTPCDIKIDKIVTEDGVINCGLYG